MLPIVKNAHRQMQLIARARRLVRFIRLFAPLKIDREKYMSPDYTGQTTDFVQNAEVPERKLMKLDIICSNLYKVPLEKNASL